MMEKFLFKMKVYKVHWKSFAGTGNNDNEMLGGFMIKCFCCIEGSSLFGIFLYIISKQEANDFNAFGDM